MREMTKRERILATIKGEEVDRVPVSFFGHNYASETSPDNLAKHLIEQNEKFDWDFIKVQPRTSYFNEAWGCKYRFSTKAAPQMEDYVVKSAEDFTKLEKLDPKKGILGEQVKVAELLNETLAGAVPYVQTVFSPMTIARRLTGTKDRDLSETEPIKRFMKENPEELHQGLSIISKTLSEYVRDSVREQVLSVFFLLLQFGHHLML